jgi:hypothetical protein
MIAEQPPGAYLVFHWDTFDNETILMHSCDTFDAAKAWVVVHYSGRLRGNGADRVDVVHKGKVVKRYSVG